MSRHASRGVAVTYGRRHQLRLVHTEQNDWGSIFEGNESNPIFCTSSSFEHDSSNKTSKTYEQNKENLTKKPALRKTRNKKTTNLYSISSDGQSNTSSDIEVLPCRNQALCTRNANTANVTKPPKGKKAINRRKPRKKPRAVQEKSGLLDVPDSITPAVTCQRHFSEFEDFSLCIEVEDNDKKRNKPASFTPSSKLSSKSSLPSVQHSTPNVHTSTPQSVHQPGFTKSNLKKLALSGGLVDGLILTPLQDGFGGTDSPFMMGRDCIDASPAFSHISRHGSLESDSGYPYLSVSQDEPAVNISSGASFLVTMRRRKASNLIMSSIMSPGFPSPSMHWSRLPHHIAEDSMVEVLAEQSMEALPGQNIQCLTDKGIDVGEKTVQRDTDAALAVSRKALSSKHVSNNTSISSQKNNQQENCLEDMHEKELCYGTKLFSAENCKDYSESRRVDIEGNSFHYCELSNIAHVQSDGKERAHMKQQGDAEVCIQKGTKVRTPCDSKQLSSDNYVELHGETCNINLNICDCQVVLDKLTDSFISCCMQPKPFSPDYDASRSLFSNNSRAAGSYSNSEFADYMLVKDHTHNSVFEQETSDTPIYYSAPTEDVSIGEHSELWSPIRNFCPYEHTSALACVREMDLEESCQSFQVLTPMKSRSSGLVVTPRAKVLLQCNQSEPVSFKECIPPLMMEKCVKIGEGVYGEVFRSENHKDNVALKIIPIEGNFTVNDEPQKTFSEILSEIVISKTLSQLSEGKSNMTVNYVQVRSCSVVQGNYPAALIKCWDTYHAAKVSENDRPDMFPDDQLFIIFEFANSGCDLDGFQFQSLEEAKSVLVQVALSLAVGEQSLGFEHRDLHWGNVLVRHSPATPMLKYMLRDQELSITTNGVQAAIIDFTLSRLHKDGCTVLTDLSKDHALFEGVGDYQFDIYRLMKKENGDNWDPFHPFTNVLWLHYLADKLLKTKTYPKSTTKAHKALARQFRTLIRETLHYNSVVHLVTECSFFTDEYL